MSNSSARRSIWNALCGAMFDAVGLCSTALQKKARGRCCSHSARSSSRSGPSACRVTRWTAMPVEIIRSVSSGGVGDSTSTGT
ncbi:hypothetical protein CLD22_12115 [Rubrivivax gelatinosus]|nr:hypothetical protein [Rubrivivax gelatinosus]